MYTFSKGYRATALNNMTLLENNPKPTARCQAELASTELSSPEVMRAQQRPRVSVCAAGNARMTSARTLLRRRLAKTVVAVVLGSSVVGVVYALAY